MSMGYEALQKGSEILSERTHTVEMDNQNLLKSYKLAERTPLQGGNLHATQIISKDEKMSLMEKFKTF